MNDFDYLNSISANSRPAAPSTFFDKRMKLALIILGVVIAVVVVLMSFSSTPTETTADSELSRLYLRTNSLITSINTYNPRIKSASLRSAGTSLLAVLTELKSNSETTLTTTYGLELGSLAWVSEDYTSVTTTDKKLETALLNNLLDRKYASELSFQVGYLLVIEETILNKTTDSSITTYLTTSHTNLTHLKSTLSTFSETD